MFFYIHLLSFVLSLPLFSCSFQLVLVFLFPTPSLPHYFFPGTLRTFHLLHPLVLLLFRSTSTSPSHSSSIYKSHFPFCSFWCYLAFPSSVLNSKELLFKLPTRNVLNWPSLSCRSYTYKTLRRQGHMCGPY